MDLPTQVIQNAHRSPNGELAWRRQDAVEAVHAIAKSNCAILASEVWLILSDGRISGSLPDKNGTPGVYGWVIERQPHEPWSIFVVRSEMESVKLLSWYPDEEELALPSGSELYYNLWWSGENELGSHAA